jgi:radical SAM superfamily enzyme YgiQ (UPF0313 family)
MKVLLVNPPSPYLDNDAAYPPMGLLYVASSFEKEGCDVKILDMACENKFSLDCDIDLIGFTCVTPNVNSVKQLIQEVNPSHIVMVGGAHPTFVPSEQFGAHIVVQGEIEPITYQILNDIKSEKFNKSYNGGLAKSDIICKPARHLVDLHNYRPGGEQATPVYTSRGCTFNCSFCCKTAKNSYRRIHSFQVTEEIDECVNDGFKNIVIGDDNFFIDHHHAKSILEYIRSNHNINLRINTDARNLNKGLIELAVSAGCTEVSMGIESGSQQILDGMNKRTTVERNRHSIALLKDHGISVKIYLVCNFPGETKETIQESIDFVLQTEPNKILVSNFSPLPGCDVFNHPEKYSIEWMSDNWDDYYLVGKGGGFKPCFTTTTLSKEKQIEYHQMLLDGIK